MPRFIDWPADVTASMTAPQVPSPPARTADMFKAAPAGTPAPAPAPDGATTVSPVDSVAPAVLDACAADTASAAVTANNPVEADPAPAAAPKRKRAKPGERRDQILQALAAMLESPVCERITTATLAKQIGGSEAALYRHFATKAEMFEGLIDFIEQAVFSLVQQIVGRDMVIAEQAPDDGARRAARIVEVVLKFGERNPGLVRVMMGDILLLENERLHARMTQFFDRIESSLRQCLRPAAGALGSASPTADAHIAASVLMSFVQGRLHRYVRTGFRKPPTEHLEASLAMLL